MLKEALKSDSMDKVHATYLLSMASGSSGMIGGQILDMASENKAIDKETLDLIHLHKTGALIAAATKMGAILGGGSPREISLFESYGEYPVDAFEIVDDILDQTSTLSVLRQSSKG